MSKSSWETTSGLLEEYDLTIKEAWFTKDPAYQEGKATILKVVGEAHVDGDLVDDEKTNFYSLGDGWEPDNGGESASHGAGKTQFNEGSNMGKLVKAIVGCGDEALAVISGRGESTDAASYRGLKFAMKRTEFTFNDRNTGEKRSYFVELPVEFLGEEAVKPAGRTAKAESGGTTTRRRRSASAETADNAGDEALRKAVIEFASEFEAHTDFAAAVLDSSDFDQADAVQADADILADILDDKGSIWAASREL